MKIAAISTLLVAAAIAFAFREAVANSWAFWVAMFGTYAALTGYAIHRMRDDGTLAKRFEFHWGDFTLGVLVGGALIGCAFLFRKFALPSGAPQTAWLFRVLLQLGNIQRVPALAIVTVFVAAMEEIVWRGLVQGELEQKFGTSRAWLATAACYAAAHLPSTVTLADPVAGPNPLLVVAALGCGAVWSFFMAKSGRLPPVIISHVTFSYFAPAIVLSPF